MATATPLSTTQKSEDTVTASSLTRGTEDQQSDSQTASEFINSQLQLEADAREALPYSFDHCTRPLGALRQNVFSCITCNPPPADPSQPYEPAGLCYGCQIACHGEHTLVEIFARRNFTCDCGTTRMSSDSPCTLRIDPKTGLKGPVHSEEPARDNTYNQNFRNRFCGCGEWYDPHQQKGTMYQCLGLATEEEGGCGEDWWHPECLLGLPRDWYLKDGQTPAVKEANGVTQPNGGDSGDSGEKEHPVPPGFPDEDGFETLICYKCVNANPWIKKYAASVGFMKKDFQQGPSEETGKNAVENSKAGEIASTAPLSETQEQPSKKRKADDDEPEDESVSSKKAKVEDETYASTQPIHASLPPPLPGTYSILTLHEDYRTHFCRCAECYADLAKHPQLLEEEETYEPPVSEDGDGQGAGSVGTGSLLERGEAALSNVDRVKAIEGVMVYNHLRDKVKSFLQPFAESGQAVGAEDIKAYFEKLRGDNEAIRAAAAGAAGGDDSGGDTRREQSGR